MLRYTSFVLLAFAFGSAAMGQTFKILNEPPPNGCHKEGPIKKCKDYYGGGATPPANTTCPTGASACALPGQQKCMDGTRQVDFALTYNAGSWNLGERTYLTDEDPDPKMVANPTIGRVTCLEKDPCTCALVGEDRVCATLVATEYGQDEIIVPYALQAIPVCPEEGPGGGAS